MTKNYALNALQIAKIVTRILILVLNVIVDINLKQVNRDTVLNYNVLQYCVFALKVNV